MCQAMVVVFQHFQGMRHWTWRVLDVAKGAMEGDTSMVVVPWFTRAHAAQAGVLRFMPTSEHVSSMRRQSRIER